MYRLLRTSLCLGLLASAWGCAASPALQVASDHYLRKGRHFALAIYGNDQLLLNTPIEKIDRDLKRAKAADDAVRTLRIASNARADAERDLAEFRKADPPPTEVATSTPDRERWLVERVGHTRATEEAARRAAESLGVDEHSGPQGYTDIYVVCHGWNFTVRDAIANYASYIELIDAYMHKRGGEGKGDFRPYFVFVTYHSTTRPLADAAASILPMGLDRPVRLFAPLVDTPLHVISAWGESKNAFIMATGRRSVYLSRSLDYKSVMSAKGNPMDRATDSGADAPVSMLIRALIELNRGIEEREDHGDAAKAAEQKARIHCVGHSYGGKIVMLSTSEALVARQQNKALNTRVIESLVVINGAFHPGEVGFRIKDEELKHVLATIPRKAFVHSHTDWANGLPFELSEIVLNKLFMHEFTNIFETDLTPFGNFVAKPVIGVAGIALTVPASAASWTGKKVVNLPFNWWYFVNENRTFGDSWIRFPLNALYFFLPLGNLSGGRSDLQGLLRSETPALGRSGLQRANMGKVLNYNPLEPFTKDGTVIDAVDFVAKKTRVDWSGDRIFSFDISKVYNSGWTSGKLFIGSHGDVRSTEHFDDDDPRTKRDFTAEFLLAITGH